MRKILSDGGVLLILAMLLATSNLLQRSVEAAGNKSSSDARVVELDDQAESDSVSTSEPDTKANPAAAVPSWFLPVADKPEALFEAGQHLSTPHAVMTWGTGWHAVAGVLLDENGQPRAHAMVGAYYQSLLRGFDAWLQTDASGRFLIYSPRGFREENAYQPDEPALKFKAFWPASALPTGNDLGFLWQFSFDCDQEIIRVADDRDFIILRTGKRRMNLTPETLLEFDNKRKQERARRRPRPRVIRLKAYEGPLLPADMALCEVKVVDEQGNGVPDAMIASSGYGGSHEAVMTNDKGVAHLHYPMPLKPRKPTRNPVRLQMSVDIPGYVTGPIPFNLLPGKTTVIQAIQGSSLSGRVINDQGKPMFADIRVEFAQSHSFLGWLSVAPDEDGRFTLNHLMPNVPFRLRIHSDTHQVTPLAGVWSQVITLKPGEKRTGIELKILHPAAVRGVVVDQQGEPVKTIYSLNFWHDGNGWGHGEDPDGRFGTYAIPPGPLEIRIKATGFKPFVSEAFDMKSGEMRYIKLVMEKE